MLQSTYPTISGLVPRHYAIETYCLPAAPTRPNSRGITWDCLACWLNHGGLFPYASLLGRSHSFPTPVANFLKVDTFHPAVARPARLVLRVGIEPTSAGNRPAALPLCYRSMNNSRTVAQVPHLSTSGDSTLEQAQVLHPARDRWLSRIQVGRVVQLPCSPRPLVSAEASQPRIGAGEGDRTLDILVGNEMLYR